MASKVNLRIKYLSLNYNLGSRNHFRESDYDILVYASCMRQVEALFKNGYLYNAFATFSPGFCLHPFSTIDVIFLVSQPALYTQFEKIFLPFQIEVWIWLMVSLAIGVLVIFLLNFTSKHTQKFIFGLRVNTPALNLLSVR